VTIKIVQVAIYNQTKMQNPGDKGMGVINKRPLSRRTFLKLGSATTISAAIGSQTKILRALEIDKSAKKKSHSSNETSHFSFCGMCVNTCALIARVRDGVAYKLDPNPNFKKSRGMLCARGNAGLMACYNPDRLKTPLLRQGERGEGKWKRISWDEALDLLANKLTEISKKYTRCGVLFSHGEDTQMGFVDRFAEVFGSYNIASHESQCFNTTVRAYVDTFGEYPFADILNTKYIIMAGANRAEAFFTPDTIDLVTAVKNGAKLVVLDPRFTKTAAIAHEWYPIKPGTDMAFTLALIHVIIKENLYDKDFIRNRTYGFEKLAEHVQQYTPQWAEGQCEIPAKSIEKIAKEMAKAAPKAIFYPGRRNSFYEDSTQIARAGAILNGILGNWDTEGGLLGKPHIRLPQPDYTAPFYDDNPEDRADAESVPMMFEETGSFSKMREAIIAEKPYPIKGWFNYHLNPMMSIPDQSKTLEMIDHLEFICTVDIIMSDTAWMSDLVLPAQAHLERKDPVIIEPGASACGCLVYHDPVIKPLFEAKSIFWILKELSKRLKLEEYFNFDIDEFRKVQLKHFPEADKAIREKGVYDPGLPVYGIYQGKRLKTSTGKIELYSPRYEEAGADPLPVYRPPQDVPPGKFRLVVGRTAIYTHNTTQNNPWLHELTPTNTLWIHPDPASKLGIKTGDLVEVESPVGKEKILAEVTEGIRPDTTFMLSGFGSMSKSMRLVYNNGACITRLLEDKIDKLTGTVAMHETFVTIRKVRS